MSGSHRWRAAVLVSSLVTVSLAACGGGASSGGADEELNLYQSLSPTQIKPVIEGFVAHYEDETGEPLKVNDFSKGAGELRSAIDLEARGKSVRADVVMTDVGEIRTLADKYPDLFDEPDGEVVADEALPDHVRETAEATPAIIAALHPYVPVYNTNKVPEDQVPSSWEDLLDGRWSGRIGLGDPETTSSAHAPMWFLADYLADESDGPFGFEYYERLGQLNPRVASQSDAIMEFLSTGELDIAILGYSTALQAARDGRPIAASLPEQGAAALTTSVAVIDESAQKSVAEMFVSWLMSDEGQQALNEGSAYLPVREGVEIPDPPFEFDTASPSIVPIDAEWVAENRDANISEFEKFVK